jgi:D-glycero-D-manno-heptose 1,7-bisphosphate phosphatase
VVAGSVERQPLGGIALKRRAIFLDRDGTLNADVGFTHRVCDLRLLDGVVPGLKHLQQLGYRLIITTNQSGIARGYFGEAQMHAFNAALVEQLGSHGITIAGIYFCPFHPSEGQGAYRRDSPLRKPAPGMILRAAAEQGLDLAASFAIGDKTSDVAAGRAAGCGTILLRSKAGEASQAEPPDRPDFTAADLVEAARFIERIARPQTGVSPSGDSAYPAGE